MRLILLRRAEEVYERPEAKSGLVESRTSTVLVARFGLIWGGRWESNPQRPEPQSGALPVELLPPHLLIITSALQVRLEREVFGLQIQRMGNVDFRIKEQISDSRFHISLRKRGQLKMCSLQSSF